MSEMLIFTHHTGASYGGYMVNWINGKAPDGCFQCLVNHDGTNDFCYYLGT